MAQIHAEKVVLAYGGNQYEIGGGGTSIGGGFNFTILHSEISTTFHVLGTYNGVFGWHTLQNQVSEDILVTNACYFMHNNDYDKLLGTQGNNVLYVDGTIINTRALFNSHANKLLILLGDVSISFYD